LKERDRFKNTGESIGMFASERRDEGGKRRRGRGGGEIEVELMDALVRDMSTQEMGTCYLRE
jgi:hypothetical protein